MCTKWVSRNCGFKPNQPAKSKSEQNGRFRLVLQIKWTKKKNKSKQIYKQTNKTIHKLVGVAENSCGIHVHRLSIENTQPLLNKWFINYVHNKFKTFFCAASNVSSFFFWQISRTHYISVEQFSSSQQKKPKNKQKNPLKHTRHIWFTFRSWVNSVSNCFFNEIHCCSQRPKTNWKPNKTPGFCTLNFGRRGGTFFLHLYVLRYEMKQIWFAVCSSR